MGRAVIAPITEQAAQKKTALARWRLFFMKVMIVDDNAEMRSLIRSLLTGVATEFVECADGREAVTAYKTEKPDWAVMDVAMKAMDGLTATRLISSQFPGSHIVVVTQHHNPKLRESAREAGAKSFLLKEDLIELRSLLGVKTGKETEGDQKKEELNKPSTNGEEP